MYTIGLRKFVVEMDAKYIKGMLANPDIQPSASINRWIVWILTFHFDLVHVKGTFHGPNGLLRRPKQPLDLEIDADDFDFEDWVDRLHGFMHQIQLLPFSKKKVFAGAQILSVKETDMKEIMYEDIPRSEKDIKDDKKMEEVKEWHWTLQRPEEFSDSGYASFVRYATEFFLDRDRLWRKDSHGAHKLVIPKERRLGILRAVHDNIGHKRFYATRKTLTQRFWWLHI
jgi:Integrase zinc binding domain